MGKNKLLILAIPIASSLTTEHFSLSFIRAKWESSVMHRDARSFGIDKDEYMTLSGKTVDVNSKYVQTKVTLLVVNES